MKLYLDLIFLLNFGFDFLLLLSVSVILRRNASLKRIILGAFVGALSIFCLFIEVTSLTLFLIKVLVSIVMIIITFSYKGIGHLLKNMGYLYMASIVLGGFLYYLNVEFSYKQDGLVFYHNGFSINVIVLIIISPIILYNYVKQGKYMKSTLQCYHKVTIVYKNKTYELTGYLDTGNTLIDPYFNKPVCIINQGIISNVLEEFIYIPITTINKKKLLKCIVADKIIINGVSEMKKVLIAFSEEKMKLDGIDLLLPRKIMEGFNC